MNADKSTMHKAMDNLMVPRSFIARFALLLLSVGLLNLSFAPVNQFYFAWIALVPFLLVIDSLRRARSAFGWGWLFGLLFFGSTMTWLWHATWLGTALVLMYLAIYWGLAASLIQCELRIANCESNKSQARSNLQSAIRNPQFAIFLIPAIFVFTEWLRGWVFTGFPWVMLSQTQVPVPALCQIADFTGHHGITFWIVVCNTIGFLMIRHRANWKKLMPAACAFAVLSTGIVAYGIWRIQQTQLTEGPSIFLIQPNFEHARGGAKLVGWEDQLRYHFDRTPRALANAKEAPDLIVWSETVMPPMNIEARRKARDPRLARGIHENLLKLVHDNRTSLVFGAYALVKHEGNDREADIRNSTYFYSYRSETQPRYDKVHLVPYGESVPFRDSIRWLHDLMFKIAAYSTNYVITHGSIDALTIFELPRCNEVADSTSQPSQQRWKFVTPICFEDTDSSLVAKMFRAENGTKRADFLVNITNSGWFNHQHRAQHLQAAALRSVENRVWTARCSNTGISGFIDSVGRAVETLPSGGEGVAQRRIGIDGRVTFYTRFGNWFPVICGAFAIFAVVRWWLSAKPN